MKKLVLIAVLAVSAAFAHEGNHKHMVRFAGFDNTGFSDTFDVSFGTSTSTGGVDEADAANNNIALNYAYNLNGAWQIGGTYKNNHTANTGDVTTVGLSGYYNLEGKVADTCYVALHLDSMNDKTGADDDKTTTIGLEYGHRFAMGSVMGMHVAFAPSLTYSTATTVYGADDTEDQVVNGLAWNWIKFDVLF